MSEKVLHLNLTLYIWIYTFIVWIIVYNSIQFMFYVVWVWWMKLWCTFRLLFFEYYEFGHTTLMHTVLLKLTSVISLFQIWKLCPTFCICQQILLYLRRLIIIANDHLSYFTMGPWIWITILFPSCFFSSPFCQPFPFTALQLPNINLSFRSVSRSLFLLPLSSPPLSLSL